MSNRSQNLQFSKTGMGGRRFDLQLMDGQFGLVLKVSCLRETRFGCACKVNLGSGLFQYTGYWVLRPLNLFDGLDSDLVGFN